MGLLKKIANRLPGGSAWENFKHQIRKERQYHMLMKNKAMEPYRQFLMRPNVKNAFIQYLFGWKTTDTKKSLKYVYENCEKMIASQKKDTVDVNGIKLKLPGNIESMVSFCFEFSDMLLPYICRDYSKINYMFIEGPYELGKVSVSPGDVVIDCGANMGIFSAVAAARGGQIYAFEPGKKIIDTYLQYTAEQNGKITIVPYGLSNYVGKASFIFSQEAMTAGYIEKNEGGDIDIMTIDRFVEEQGLSRVDFIKSDIEGEERNMLRGASETLKRFSPKLSICKYHLPDDPEVLKKIILEANPDYVIKEKYMKLYAYVPKKGKDKIKKNV